MAVKVIKNRVFDGNKTYEVGDTIKGLSEKEESRLVSGGIAEYLNNEKVSAIENKKADNSQADNGNDNVTSFEGEENNDLPPENGEVNEELALETEEGETNTIDPDLLSLKPEDYVKNSPTKSNKGK